MNTNGIPILSNRAREVWTYDNKRLLDRMCTLLHSANVRVLLECSAPLCPSPLIVLVRDERVPSARLLRCGCTDRHFEPRGMH